MIYGYSITINGKIVTLVVSADDIDELNAWVKDIDKLSKKYDEHNKPGFMDYMQEEHLKGLKDFCHTFTHEDMAQQKEFLAEAGVDQIHTSHALDYQLDMIATQKVKENPDMTPEDWMTEHGETPISEIYGLEKDSDKWDRRTEEDKQKDKMEIHKAGQLASEGKMTMPSFIPQPKEETEDGISITGASVIGGLVSVTATKNEKKKGNEIQLSADAIKELEDIKNKVSKEIYHEKHKTAVARAGLKQVGLNEDEINRVLTEVTNARVDLVKVINEIKTGTFDKENYTDVKVIKDATAGDDYSRTDLAERSVKVIEILRENAFSDELANSILSKVDPASCPTQEAYIEAIEAAANEAIKDKNYRVELTKAQDENRPFALKEDDFVNPFADEDDEDGTETVIEDEEVEEPVNETTKPQPADDPLAPIIEVFGEPTVDELIIDLADSSGRTIETWKDGPKKDMMKLVDPDGSVKVLKMNASYIVEELASIPAGSIDAKAHYDDLMEKTFGVAIEKQFGPDTISSDPKDYYFAVKVWDNMTCVAICPKSYFDSEKCQWDQHVSDVCGGPLKLPDGFEEMEEAGFVYHGTAKEARAACLILGMEDNAEYNKYMS